VDNVHLNGTLREEHTVPQIIVMADGSTDHRDATVMFRERVSVSDLESRHFASQLLERLGWAVGDAHEVESEHEHESVQPQRTAVV
jgi:hypothetical protein